jgi:hypothetical protein
MAQRRDSRGRFAGGGGGGGKGGGSKPKTTTAKGRARTAEASARQAVKAGGGTKATRSLLTAQRARDYYKATGKPAPASKPAPARTSKAAPNKAKEKYRAARSEARELKMYRGGRTDAVVKKAEAKVARMEKKRRSSRAR